MSELSQILRFIQVAHNVPRLYEVFAERSGAKIWVERSGTI